MLVATVGWYWQTWYNQNNLIKTRQILKLTQKWNTTTKPAKEFHSEEDYENMNQTKCLMRMMTVMNMGKWITETWLVMRGNCMWLAYALMMPPVSSPWPLSSTTKTNGEIKGKHSDDDKIITRLSTPCLGSKLIVNIIKSEQPQAKRISVCSQ